MMRLSTSPWIMKGRRLHNDMTQHITAARCPSPHQDHIAHPSFYFRWLTSSRLVSLCHLSLPGFFSFYSSCYFSLYALLVFLEIVVSSAVLCLCWPATGHAVCSLQMLLNVCKKEAQCREGERRKGCSREPAHYAADEASSNPNFVWVRVQESWEMCVGAWVLTTARCHLSCTWIVIHRLLSSGSHDAEDYALLSSSAPQHMYDVVVQ